MSSIASEHSAEVDDPVENMLKKTGCMELHFKVQECIAEKQDWRLCQEEVKSFRTCMNTYTIKKKALSSV